MLIFKCVGGEVVVPDQLVLIDRMDGGTLIVLPPREVWERSELDRDELTAWSFLIAATGRAMIDTLPQLEGGCINYWDAGNWSLNELADPVGPKTGSQARKVHMHLLGRSSDAKNPSTLWGEAPKFPDYVDRLKWASNNERLTAAESRDVVARVEEILKTKYEMSSEQIDAWMVCASCGYPTIKPHQECLAKVSTITR